MHTLLKSQNMNGIVLNLLTHEPAKPVGNEKNAFIKLVFPTMVIGIYVVIWKLAMSGPSFLALCLIDGACLKNALPEGVQQFTAKPPRGRTAVFGLILYCTLLQV